MGVYYDFYLEKRVGEDRWSSINYLDSDILFSVRSYARAFFDEYGCVFPLGFQRLSQEYQSKYKEKYDSSNDIEKSFICRFYEMDIDKMIKDYNAGLHEYAGIISKNAYRHLMSNCEYEAKIIDEEIFARLTNDIKKNYIYHEWDTFYGEYYYLYEIVPLVERVIEANKLNINDVRLLCRIG